MFPFSFPTPPPDSAAGSGDHHGLIQYASSSSNTCACLQCLAYSSSSPLTATDAQYSTLAADITCLFWFSSWSAASADFRSFVSGLLARTQVSRPVITLALLYLHRLRMCAPHVVAGAAHGSEFRVFTVAVMLASKFLDDNTFTNRTWADVSRMPVREITVMEVEFLRHVDYDLVVNATQWADWTDTLAGF
ncbi:cyclin-domain-containing protein, partial [Lipomyces japonicus]|uniref:cyclin-domain-containing protein n=1 Tax=Lipomyces japonicus TaxID=56871 RepID=UPI0034CF9A2F